MGIMNDAVWRRRGWLHVPLTLAVLWQLSATLPGFPASTVSSPVMILKALWASVMDVSLFTATAQTLLSALCGMAMGVVAGALAGVATGSSSRVDQSATLVTEWLRPVPSVAIMPLALLTFGFGFGMEVSVVAFATFWPVMVIVRSATRGIDRQRLELARSLELPFVKTVRTFVLPSILRELFVGIQLAAGVAFVVAVTVEIAVNPRGLGYLLISAQAGLDVDKVWAALLWVGVVGWLVSVLLRQAEGRLFRYAV